MWQSLNYIFKIWVNSHTFCCS